MPNRLKRKKVAKLGWPLESRLGPNEVAEPNDFQVLHEMKCFVPFTRTK